MRWFYILVLTIALTHTVSSQAHDPTHAVPAVDAEQNNADRAAKTLKDKLAEYEEAHTKAKNDPNSRNDEGKLWSDVEKEKETEVTLAAKDKSIADAALKATQDRLANLKADTEGGRGHQSEDSSQNARKSEGDRAREEAKAKALETAASQKPPEEQKQEEKKKEEEPKPEATQTAEKEKPSQDNQEEQVANPTIPSEIKEALEAQYAKKEEPNSNTETPSEKNSEGYNRLIKKTDEESEAIAQKTSETLATLNEEQETASPGEAATSKETAVTVNDYINGVVQNNSVARSPASTTRNPTPGTAAPRAMKGTSSTRLLNALK
jgi:hypothetical protein